MIDIDVSQLPSAETVAAWTSEQFVAALEHDAAHPEYNLNLRQLIHVGFKIAARMGDRYANALAEHADIIGAGVTHNLLERHIRVIFA